MIGLKYVNSLGGVDNSSEVESGRTGLLGSEERVLLAHGLETAVADLGGGIDELEVGLLEGLAAGDGAEGLAEGDGALAGSHDGALDEKEVVVDSAVVGEATEGRDGLLGDVALGAGAVRVAGGTDAVDLLVDHGTMVETHLTGTGHLELHAGRMPGADTGDLANASVGLPGKDGGPPALDDALDSVALVDANDVAHLVLGEDGVDGQGLLEEALGELDLFSHALAAVDLDLHHVRALLPDLGLAHLGVGNETDGMARRRHLLELRVDVLRAVVAAVLGEGGLLALVPASVVTTLELVTQVLGPHGSQGALATGGLDVANDAHGNHGGAVDDGASLNDVGLVEPGAGALDFADNVSHAGLVAHEGSQVARHLGGVHREGLDAALSTTAPFAGQETQGPMTGSFEFAVAHSPSLALPSLPPACACKKLTLSPLARYFAPKTPDSSVLLSICYA